MKPHQPLHNFPEELRWIRNTHLPKPHSTTAADQVEEPVPKVDDRGMTSQMAPSQKNGSNGGGDGDMSNGNRGSTQPRGAAEGSGGGRGSERQRKAAKDKQKIWISLTKDEIEEDIYSMTGARPRRPRKRPRNVQKLIDNVFPALNLVGMSAQSYRVQDSMVD